MSQVDNMFKKEEILEILGVPGRKWEDCSWGVHASLLDDWMTNLSPKITDILNAGYDTLVYSGDKDWICNWRGGEKWTHNISWKGKKDFNKNGYTKWNVDD